MLMIAEGSVHMAGKHGGIGQFGHVAKTHKEGKLSGGCQASLLFVQSKLPWHMEVT